MGCTDQNNVTLNLFIKLLVCFRNQFQFRVARDLRGGSGRGPR